MKMEIKTAIEILEYHQEWRLGKRKDMIHEPKKLTQAIDIILSEVKRLPTQFVVKSLKDKEVISFEKFVDKYYIRKDFKYFNKKGKAFTATQIVTIYNEHINNLLNLPIVSKRYYER